MAKGREKKTLQDIDTEKGRVLGEEQQFMQSLAPQTEGYTEFAKTGGISPKTEEEIQQRETSSLQSMYGDLQNRLSQQKAIQGGYSPGYGAQTAQLGRQAGEQIAEGRRDTDIALQELIRSGKLAGLGGLGQVSQEQLASMGLTAGDINNLLRTRAGLSVQPGLFDNIMKGIGTVTGGWANMTGGGA